MTNIYLVSLVLDNGALVPQKAFTKLADAQICCSTYYRATISVIWLDEDEDEKK